MDNDIPYHLSQERSAGDRQGEDDTGIDQLLRELEKRYLRVP